MRKKTFSIFFILFLVGAGFVSGFFYGKFQVVCQVCPKEDVDFSLFWETWNKLEEKYVDKDKFNVQDMVYGAISGMVKSLGDPYTVFMEPEESKIFIDDVKGSFEGVGMEIGIRKGQLQVIAPLEGTPAQRAGMKAGDKIMQIDGKATLDMGVDEAVKLIRGQKGTEVVLTIYRSDWDETKEIGIIRDKILIPSLKLEFQDDNIAYIQLYQFSEKASYDFNVAALEIINGPADRIILDLRNNPGGYLEVAQDIAGWFLERGQVVVIEDLGPDKDQKVFKAQGNGKLAPYPLVVLINQGSASGSEILAGALRDNRSIKLIGETSFGKGSVQEIAKLRDNSSLKITVAKWLTPKGESISEKGLEPDIEVEVTEKDEEQDKDPQLEKAVEILKNL